MLRPGFTMYSRTWEKLARRTCQFCGRDLTPHQAVSTRTCSAPECHERFIEKTGAEMLARRRKAGQALRRRLRRRAAAAITEGLEVLGADGRQVPLVVVPWQGAPVVPVPEARREALAAHLSRIAAEAFAAPPPEGAPPAVAEAPAVLVAACATCQGNCCRKGGDTGNLTAADLRRYRQANPEATAEQAVSAFLAHLPAAATEDGCVYQAAEGCALPRALRSRKCNTYLCHGLESLAKRAPARLAGRAVIVAAEADRPRTVAVAQPGTGYREIASYPPEAEPGSPEGPTAEAIGGDDAGN